MHSFLIIDMTASLLCFCLCFVSVWKISSAAPLQFVDRPAKFAQGFPDPGSFLETGGRRLEASEGKPKRTRYESEQSGHKFEYEFAGNSTSRIINIDIESVVSGMFFEHGGGSNTDGTRRIWLRTASESELRAPRGLGFALNVGDVITGGPEWGCHRNNATGFLVEVLTIESDNSSIIVNARDTSPFSVYRDLFVDFTWTPNAQARGDRRLYDIDHDIFRWGQSKGFTDPFGIVSGNANVDAVLKFQLVGEGFDVDRVSLGVEFSMDVRSEAHLVPGNIKNVVNNGWYQVNSILGDDILGGLVDALKIPFFNEINQATVNLQLRPAFSLSTWVEFKDDIKNLLDQVLNAGLEAYLTSNGPLKLEIFWDKQNGFGLTIPDYKTAIKMGIKLKGLAIPKDFLTKLKQCFGVELLAFGESVTSLKMCPFQSTKLWKADNLTVPATFMKSDPQPDSELCIDIQEFETNIDKNTLKDTAVGKVCFHGTCISTSPVTFGIGKSVEFNDGPQCIPIKRSWLDLNPMFFRAVENTMWTGWNQYTPPHELSSAQLAQKCPDLTNCLLPIKLPAPDKKYATLTVKISLADNHARRLDVVEQGSLGGSSRQLGHSDEGERAFACTSLAVASEFSGLRYGTDDYMVVDPVHGEPIEAVEPICEQVSPKEDLVSGALHQTGVCLTAFLAFVLLHPH
jgi:hypothetical protein